MNRFDKIFEMKIYSRLEQKKQQSYLWIYLCNVYFIILLFMVFLQYVYIYIYIC